MATVCHPLRSCPAVWLHNTDWAQCAGLLCFVVFFKVGNYLTENDTAFVWNCRPIAVLFRMLWGSSSLITVRYKMTVFYPLSFIR